MHLVNFLRISAGKVTKSIPYSYTKSLRIVRSTFHLHCQALSGWLLLIGLAHELVHALQGQQSEWVDGPHGGAEGSIPAVEVESINMENLVRYSLNHPLRYNYWVGHDETLVPPELLINPVTGNPFGNYFNHSTNNGQTFADYASQLEMSTDELKKLNPHIQDLGNLQNGEVIIIAPETESEDD